MFNCTGDAIYIKGAAHSEDNLPKQTVVCDPPIMVYESYTKCGVYG